MDEDLRPKEFARNYPTAGCLIGCAIIGLVLLMIAIPICYYLLMWYGEAMSHA